MVAHVHVCSYLLTRHGMHTRASSLMLIFFMACCRLGPEGKKDDALTTPKVKKSKSHDPVEEGSHTKHKKQAPQAEQTPREPQTHTRLTAAKAKVTKPEPVVACVKNECVTPVKLPEQLQSVSGASQLKSWGSQIHLRCPQPTQPAVHPLCPLWTICSTQGTKTRPVMRTLKSMRDKGKNLREGRSNWSWSVKRMQDIWGFHGAWPVSWQQLVLWWDDNSMCRFK